MDAFKKSGNVIYFVLGRRFISMENFFEIMIIFEEVINNLAKRFFGDTVRYRIRPF